MNEKPLYNSIVQRLFRGWKPHRCGLGAVYGNSLSLSREGAGY